MIYVDDVIMNLKKNKYIVYVKVVFLIVFFLLVLRMKQGLNFIYLVLIKM